MLIDRHSQRRLAGARGGESNRIRMIKVGFGPTGSAIWTTAEERVVERIYPDYDLMEKTLPYRSRLALKTRAQKLGVAYRNLKWTEEQIALLRKNYPTVNLRELQLSLGHSRRSMLAKAGALGIRRDPVRYPPTGNALLDDLYARCFELRYSRRDLDIMAVTGSYFSGARNVTRKYDSSKIARGVLAIGGKLMVAWDDEVRSVD